VRAILEPLRKIFLNDDDVDPTRKPSATKHRFRFEDAPFTVLLSMCDLFQEWGRPGGKPKPSFPKAVDEVIKLNSSGGLDLRVTLVYRDLKGMTGIDQKRLAGDRVDDYNRRLNQVRILRTLLVDRGPLKNFHPRFKGNKSDMIEEIL
jgi:hypothetical protein